MTGRPLAEPSELTEWEAQMPCARMVDGTARVELDDVDGSSSGAGRLALLALRGAAQMPVRSLWISHEV